MTDKTGRPDAVASPSIDLKRVSLLWAVPGHASEIARAHATLFPSPWDEAAIADLLVHPGSLAMVATHGNPTSIGGFALARIAADEAEIITIGVIGSWQRLGVGKALVDGIKRAAARGGARSIFLEVAQSNAAARALYARSGFLETGCRKGYYAPAIAGTPAEDAVVMRCEVVALPGR
jgi:ribosomal-protein-alanine N-acetyltransferase